MRRNRLRLLLPALLVLACGDGPSEPRPVLAVEVDGRVERGSVVQLTARLNGAATGSAEWSAEPASAVEWQGSGAARLLSTGAVRFRASVGDASASVDTVVALPPSVVFERTASGVRDLWRMALDGGDLVRLTDDAAEDRHPSAASGTVYFVSGRVAPAAVYGVPAAGGAAERVTTVTGRYDEAVISADGQRLAFLRDVGGVPKVHISNRDGGNARRLTTSGGGVIEVSPAWSPDGLHVAFVTTAAGNADIHVMPVAGGAATVVAATGEAEVEPAWSPDGARVVYVRATGGTATDLWVADVAGGAAVRLTTTGTAARPLWLADGRVVFTVLDGGRRLRWLEPGNAGSVRVVPHDFDIAGRPAPIR